VPVWALAAGAAALGVVVAATLWISSDSRPASPAAVATGDGEAAAAAGDVPATEQPGNIAANADAPGSARDLRRGSPPPGSRARSSAARGPVVRLTDKAGYPLDAGAAATGVATTTPPAGDADAIFSNASSDVRPPVAITPLPVTGRNPNFESTATLELLVDEKGTVAGVKLLSQPTQIQPLMLLSAAKTWMFRPALRDGRPVKYRLRVDVPATTR
jgi:hypothetical protein